jgi:hypothetical protein
MQNSTTTNKNTMKFTLPIIFILSSSAEAFFLQQEGSSSISARIAEEQSHRSRIVEDYKNKQHGFLQDVEHSLKTTSQEERIMTTSSISSSPPPSSPESISDQEKRQRGVAFYTAAIPEAIAPSVPFNPASSLLENKKIHQLVMEEHEKRSQQTHQIKSQGSTNSSPRRATAILPSSVDRLRFAMLATTILPSSVDRLRLAILATLVTL